MVKALGFTGTREGMTGDQYDTLEDKLRQLRSVSKYKEAHHGDCVGADEQFHKLASEQEYYMVIHPPEKEDYRAFCEADRPLKTKDYITRNHNIVRMTNVLIATPKTWKEEQRSGTWATIRYAMKIGKPVLIIFPDGSSSVYL